VIGARAFLLGMALFPNMVISAVSPEYNLTIYNAASSQKTLAIAALIALIGMPMVVTYTAIVYWVFRGKVRMGDLIY
jgi:cytochrome d ubiquinol oxidase subunit II